VQIAADISANRGDKTEWGRWGGRKPGPLAAEDVAFPSATDIPQWSEPTLRLLRDLSPLQRAFAEWTAAGYSGAEAYRRASRRADLGPNARNNAALLNRNPKVRVAIDAALGDSNFGALMDRSWLFAKLLNAVEKAEDSDSPRAAAVVCRLVRLVAELKGEFGRSRQPVPASTPQVAKVYEQFEEVLAQARGQTDCRAASSSLHAAASPPVAASDVPAFSGEPSNRSPAASSSTGDCGSGWSR
jgi:hypothetical protein